MPEWESGVRGDFDVSVAIAPEPRDASEPIFVFDGAAGAGSIFGGKDASGCWEFGAGEFSAYGAGSNFDLRIVANAFDLAEFAAGHEVELIVFFGEPDGGVDGNTGFAEGG